MKRIIPLADGEVYHILNRSIAEFRIFNAPRDYLRMLQLLKYYQCEPDLRFSYLIRQEKFKKQDINSFLFDLNKDKDPLVQIISYCIMPTHIHLVLKQLAENGITKYLRNILNSYSHYFNIKHKRKGPLWEAKFKNILVKNDEQLLHLTRYIHLNPTTALLVKKPEEWEYSSYKEYLKPDSQFRLINYEGILEIRPSSYQKFVNERISHQRELAKIKTLLLD